MKIITELSLYPLTEDYGNAVLSFIHALREAPDLELRTNSMSTQIVGEWDLVMRAVRDALQKIDEQGMTLSLVMKIINHPLELDWIEVQA